MCIARLREWLYSVDVLFCGRLGAEHLHEVEQREGEEVGLLVPMRPMQSHVEVSLHFGLLE